MKLFLISSCNGEVVGFTNRTDASWTATGKFKPVWQSALGASFREDNGAEDNPKKQFPMIEIELTPEQVKKLRIPPEKNGPTLVRA